MAAAVPLRSDFDAEGLRGLAKGSRDPAQTRRLLALSVIAAGGSRSAAAAIGGVGLQTVRDWVVAFNADGPDGLIDGKAPGARPRLNAEQREALVEQGPAMICTARLGRAEMWLKPAPSGARVRPNGQLRTAAPTGGPIEIWFRVPCPSGQDEARIV